MRKEIYYDNPHAGDKNLYMYQLVSCLLYKSIVLQI